MSDEPTKTRRARNSRDHSVRGAITEKVSASYHSARRWRLWSRSCSLCLAASLR
jgi:hypothetical protein